jgi:uncharacterized protein (DUF1330 family)
MHKNLLVCLRRRGRLPSAPATLLGQYASRRMIGSGYEGAREAGYDATAMNELRALKHDQPFFMLNLLKVTDVDSWMKYCDLAQAPFEMCGAVNIYSGSLKGTPVPVKAEGIDTSDYNLVLLNRFPSTDAFFAFVDSPEYQAAYPYRIKGCEAGKTSLIVTLPMGGTATE